MEPAQKSLSAGYTVLILLKADVKQGIAFIPYSTTLLSSLSPEQLRGWPQWIVQSLEAVHQSFLAFWYISVFLTFRDPGMKKIHYSSWKRCSGWPRHDCIRVAGLVQSSCILICWSVALLSLPSGVKVDMMPVVHGFQFVTCQDLEVQDLVSNTKTKPWVGTYWRRCGFTESLVVSVVKFHQSGLVLGMLLIGYINGSPWGTVVRYNKNFKSMVLHLTHLWFQRIWTFKPVIKNYVNKMFLFIQHYLINK